MTDLLAPPAQMRAERVRRDELPTAFVAVPRPAAEAPDHAADLTGAVYRVTLALRYLRWSRRRLAIAIERAHEATAVDSAETMYRRTE